MGTTKSTPVKDQEPANALGCCSGCQRQPDKPLSVEYLAKTNAHANSFPGILAELGDTLESSFEQIKTMDALADKTAIGFYFSSSSSKSCSDFTQKLKESYKSHLQGKGLEIIYVGRDEKLADHDFKESVKAMPWLTLPTRDEERAEALRKRLRVSSLPSFAIIGLDGRVITKSACNAVLEDPSGENYPWAERPLKELLNGSKLVSENGGQSLSITSNWPKAKVLGLYFAASWCPPCQSFTPRLAGWYEDCLKEKGLEVVYVSSDKDKDSFEQSFHGMPWLALDFADRSRRDQLATSLRLKGLPSLVIVDKDGSVITTDGRSAVMGDPQGIEFPWYPKPVADLGKTLGQLHDLPSIVAFCETRKPSERKQTEQILATVAARCRTEQEEAGDEEPKFSFLIAKEISVFAGRLRMQCSLPDAQIAETAEMAAPARLVLVDMASGTFCEAPAGDVTIQVINGLLDGFESGSLVMKPLKG